jgi:hypothetical protein
MSKKIDDGVRSSIAGVAKMYIEQGMEPGHMVYHLAIVMGEIIGEHVATKDEIKEHANRVKRTVTFEANKEFKLHH